MFKNAKIVTENARPSDYNAIGGNIPRGQIGFVMNSKHLSVFATNPRKWRNGVKIDPEPNEKHIDFGSIVDCLLLSPDQFESRYAVTPPTYRDSKEKEKDWTWLSIHCRDWRDARQEEGKEVITPDKLAEAKAAAKVLKDDEQVLYLNRTSRNQVLITAEYHDESTGIVIPVKMMPDMVPYPDVTPEVDGFRHCIINLKTTLNAAPGKWAYAVGDNYYHWAAAIHLDGWNAATGENRDTYLHLIQESVPPYEVCKRFLSQEFLEIGRLAYRAALECYCACLKTGEWPGYLESDFQILDGWSRVDPTGKVINAPLPSIPQRKEQAEPQPEKPDEVPV